jgi:hypothetical protein
LVKEYETYRFPIKAAQGVSMQKQIFNEKYMVKRGSADTKLSTDRYG